MAPWQIWGVSPFGKVPSLTPCLYNIWKPMSIPYMLPIAGYFTVAHLLKWPNKIHPSEGMESIRPPTRDIKDIKHIQTYWSLCSNKASREQENKHRRFSRSQRPGKDDVQVKRLRAKASLALGWSCNRPNTTTSYRQMVQRMEAPTVLNKAGPLLKLTQLNSSVWGYGNHPISCARPRL